MQADQLSSLASRGVRGNADRRDDSFANHYRRPASNALPFRREAQHQVSLWQPEPGELVSVLQPSLILIRNGEMVASARDYQLRLQPGRVLVTDGREPFLIRTSDTDVTDILVFTPDPRCLRAPTRRGPERTLLLPMVHEASSEMSRLMQQLAETMQKTMARQLLGPRPAQFWLDALIAAQSDYQDAIERCHGRTDERRRDLFVRLSRARAVLAAERGSGGDVERLAEIARLSPSHFVRLFHKVFGEPPHSFRLRRRMENAHRLISETGMSVQEVMWRVGFDNHSCFARAFRRHFGCSATAVREKTITA